MEEAIVRDCGGTMENVKTDVALARCVKKLEGRSVLNIGIIYGWVKALLSRAVFDERYIEITMVEVKKERRGKGEFKRFVVDMKHVCHMRNKGLIIGAVSSSRMLKICEKQGWKRFAADPTSYMVQNIDG